MCVCLSEAVVLRSKPTTLVSEVANEISLLNEGPDYINIGDIITRCFLRCQTWSHALRVLHIRQHIDNKVIYLRLKFTSHSLFIASCINHLH